MILRGIDGRNPLGFLAALGALALLDDELGDAARLGWRRAGAAFRPFLTVPDSFGEEEVIDAIVQAHLARDLVAELGWAEDVMKITRAEVRALIERSLEVGDTRAAAMVAACVAELPARRRGDGDHVPYTPFRVIPRSGRARFLATARALSKGLRRPEQHLAQALFGPWSYRKANSMRWDPGATLGARAYTAEAPTHFGPLGVPGAIVLGVVALRFFPLVAAGGRAACRGFGSSAQQLVWPIWEPALSVGAVGIILSLPELHERAPNERVLRCHGVIARLVAQREQIGEDDDVLSWGEERLLGPSSDSGTRGQRHVAFSALG